MRLVLLFFGLILTLPMVAQNPLGFSFNSDQEYVELSFKEESNLIVIPIKLNGAGPFNFILDTGSESGMIFDRWVIGSNNLVNARQIPIYARDGDKVTDLLVANDLKIELTGIKGSSQTMLVFQENDLDIRNALGVEAHGLLGSELFSRFIVEVDYENEKLRLYEPDSFSAPKGFKSLDIILDDFRPFIQVKLKQKKKKEVTLNLLVDSGASSPLFLDYENHDFIDFPEKTVKQTLGSSVVGNLDGATGRIQRIKLSNKFKFTKVVSSFPKDWEIKKNIGDGNNRIVRHGTLGSDILSRFNIIFDYFNEKIYLRPNRFYSEPFTFNRAGFSFAAIGKELNNYFITEIVENSPSETAGLEAGDEIISIDGKPIFFYTFSEINAILRGPAGKKLTIIIQRNNELFKKVIKLKKLV